MTIVDRYAAGLDELDARHLVRTRRVVEAVRGPRVVVDGREMLAFCGNDYLGLAQHPDLVAAAQRGAAEWGLGATASPLVCGHTAAHEALERELAAFVGLPRALYFHAGFGANAGIVPALVGRGDAVFSDALNHASLIDGTRLSRADVHVYPHADLDVLDALLRASPAERKLVLSDGVFSMDGDVADVAALLALCDRHDALLLVDDAHGFGVLGPQGRGCAAQAGVGSPRLLYLATLSKAAGASGAFVAGDAVLVEWLMQRTRSYLFATAAPPAVAEALRVALRLIERDDWRRERLARHIARLRAALRPTHGELLASPTPIQPLVLGDNASALAAMQRLWQRGLWVPAIRPPTVPAGRARLRISLSAAHEAADIEQLIEGLTAVTV